MSRAATSSRPSRPRSRSAARTASCRRASSSAGGGGGSSANGIGWILGRAPTSGAVCEAPAVILQGGTVRTGDPRLPQASAIAIAGDRVAGGVDVREGDRSQVSVERHDLDGRCVVPGFCDAHVHFLEWALSLHHVDLGGSRSLAEVLASVREAREAGGAGWLLGHGWREGRWAAGGHPPPAPPDP